MMTYPLLVGALAVVVVVVIIVYRHKRQRQKVTPGFKAVLITGCDHGFGNMLARRLDGEGYKVFAGCLDANGEGAKNLQSETSPRLELLQLDVTNGRQIETARSTVVELLTGHMLWAVVNNAGIADHAEFEWYPKASFQKLIEVNLMGVINVTRAFLPLVRAAKGRIVNMSSMSGRTALPGFTGYAAAKFGVIGFSESLRREMSHFGVKVITLEPALYKTNIACRETLISNNETYWAATDPGIKRDYGENYFQDTQASRKQLLHWASDSVHEVVDCYVDAVTATHPKIRYVPPMSMQILNDLFNCLPYSVQDAVMGLIMGVKTKPEVLCPQAPENCRMGRRRSHAT